MHLYSRRFSLVFVLKTIIFLAAISISLYQSSILIQTLIKQPIVVTTVPQIKSYMYRPDVIVCQNIYGIYLNDPDLLKDITKEEALALAHLARYPEVKLFSTGPSIKGFAIPKNREVAQNYPFPKIENNLKEIALQIQDCQSFLGMCNTMHTNLAGPAFNCCDKAVQVLTTNSVCYHVKHENLQMKPGQSNAAIYELWFPSVVARSYYVYFQHYDSEIEISQQLHDVEVQPNTYVEVKVDLKVINRLNFTKQCASQHQFSQPSCRRRNINLSILQMCNCSFEEPFWMPAVKASIDRPCRLLENWNCTRSDVLKYKSLLSKFEKDRPCYDSQCTSHELVINTVSGKLDMYYNMLQNGNGTSSVISVYYLSMTVIVENEERTLTWTSVASALGGIWGLWLGLSLFDVAQLALSFRFDLRGKARNTKADSAVQTSKF